MASPVRFPEKERELEMAKKFNLDGSPIESGRDKFFRKMKEQPAVPVGSLLTIGALIAASHYLRKGDRVQFQRALRWRVGLQGATVVAAVAGTFYLGSGAPAATGTGPSSEAGVATIPGRPATVHQTQKAEERREADRALLRERLREAELKTEREEKRRAEEALLKPGGQEVRSRPIIGQDGRNRSRKE